MRLIFSSYFASVDAGRTNSGSIVFLVSDLEFLKANIDVPCGCCCKVDVQACNAVLLEVAVCQYGVSRKRARQALGVFLGGPRMSIRQIDRSGLRRLAVG